MSSIPTPYTRQSNFTSFATPDAPTVGQGMEAEFNKLEQAIDATQSRLAGIQRDDGMLRNLSVHPDSLNSVVRKLLTIGDGEIRGAWATAQNYDGKDVASNNGAWYIAAIAHSSGADFDVDKAAGKWLDLSTAEGMTFLQTGTGSQARTVQSKLREIISVKDFGAIGDGNADDTAAIQAAVDYASSLYGAEVFFPCGNYKITSPILQRPNSNITLVGQGNLQGGTNIIATGAYFIKTANQSVNSINFYHLTFVGLRNGTQSFWDQSSGGSWGYSTMDACYVVNVPIFDVLTTGAHVLNNNFLNQHTLRFRGGDYYVWNNFMGYDDQDTTKGASDAFVEILASNGVDFSGNYITSMKTSGAPVVLSVSNGADIRVISNWIDGGESHGLSVNSGSSNVVATHNRFANIYSSTNVPVLLSNVRTVSIQHNIVQGLLTNAPFIQFASLLKRCVVKDNLLNGWADDSVHDFTGALSISDVKMSGYGLAVKAITASQDITPPLYGRTLTNSGASGTVFWYVYPTKFLAGDFFNFTRTNTSSRVIIYNVDAAAAIYDSDTAGFNKGRVMCYEDGAIVVEQG